MSTIEKITAQVAEIASSTEAKVKEAISASESKVQEQLDKAINEQKELVSNLEAKVAAIQAPAVVREKKSVIGEVNRRVTDSLKEMVKGGRGAKEVQLFTDEGEADAFMREASALTGSGLDAGGRRDYDPFFVTMRQENPLRSTSRIVQTTGSDYQFRVKTGNAGATWGYSVQNNGAATTENTQVWNQSLQDLNAQFPVRTAFLDDADGAESMIVFDLLREFAQAEAGAMVQNDPGAAAGSGYQVGANGPRGLDSYAGSAAAANTSVPSALGVTAGAHTIGSTRIATNVTAAGVIPVSYSDLVSVMHNIPPQYWTSNMAWQISPSLLGAIRSLKDSAGAPIFDRMNTLTAEGYIGTLFGYPVYVNAYLDSGLATGTGTNNYFPAYFGDFKRGHAIVDRLGMTVRRYDQTQPGSLVFFAEKRVASAVVDPLAIARLQYVAA